MEIRKFECPGSLRPSRTLRGRPSCRICRSPYRLTPDGDVVSHIIVQRWRTREEHEQGKLDVASQFVALLVLLGMLFWILTLMQGC